MTLRASLLAVLCALSVPSASFAFQDPLGWNAARPLELMERARARRDLPRGDSTLRNYTAKANGFVYFYLDRRETDERTLVKVDQIAIDLYWKSPDRTKQRIVGLRDVSRLPNRMYYHLDHLTVVQNGFGDVIKVGDGDEVRDVPHPAAGGADTIYDYRLADSVTLQLGGDQGEVRVYEVQVRPKRTDRSALIGSVFVDRATADIVRMTFTFTPASYVDRRLDYINISLDNGLFAGRYWLPAEQSVEIRRQIPELDFAAGAVIKGRVRVGNYEFNEQLSDTLFWGRPVSAVPEAQRRNYDFPVDIYAGVTEDGLGPTARMEELQELAKELVGVPRLSGLPSWRLFVPNASSVLRHNNAEGWYGGFGVTYVPSPTFNTDITLGYAFGAERPEVTISPRWRSNDVVINPQLYYNAPRDIGPFAGVAGAINTLTSAAGERDYTDIYFTRGASLSMLDASGGYRAGVSARAEAHRPALGRGELHGHIREVLPGRLYEIGVLAFRPLADEHLRFDWAWRFHGGVGEFRHEVDGNDPKHRFARGTFGIETRMNSADTRTTFIGRVDAATTLGGPDDASQFNYLLGGRETLPGHDYRSIDANAFVLGRAELARTIAFPWLRVRALGSAAVASVNEDEGDITGLTGLHPYASAGVGVGLLWDVIRIDFMKGERWQTVISLRPDFWDLL